MKRLIVVVLALTLLAVVTRPASTLAAPRLQFQGEVVSPRPNAVLRGQVAIEGTADHPEFWKYEVRVAPGLNPAVSDDQWFRVVVREERVFGGQLAVWNTTSVPDGVYTLRLRVVRLDGNWLDVDVRPLSVSNAAPPTPVPPTAVPPTSTPQATLTLSSSPTAFQSPTPFQTVTPFQSPTATGSPTPLISATPTGSPTPEILPTLEPSSGQTPSPEVSASVAPEPTIEGATPLPTSPAPEGTAIVVAQPSIVVPTSTVFAAGGAVAEESSFPTPSANDDFGLPFPTIEGFEVRGLASACFSGMSFTVGIFLLLGLLSGLRFLVRLIR
jgi:hypothetical protein